MMPQEKLSRWPLIGGVVASVAASLCCLGPLILVMLGIGGAWIAHLSVLEPFRPFFLAIAVVFLLLAYRKIYRGPQADCKPGSLCALPQVNRTYKAMFWLVVIMTSLAMTFPYLAPLFY